eukprot:1008362-Pelagomonas_calceolata.AAC.3
MDMNACPSATTDGDARTACVERRRAAKVTYSLTRGVLPDVLFLNGGAADGRRLGACGGAARRAPVQPQPVQGGVQVCTGAGCAVARGQGSAGVCVCVCERKRVGIIRGMDVQNRFCVAVPFN